MRLRIPITTMLAGILFVVLVSTIKAQEDPLPTPLSKDILLPLPPPMMTINAGDLAIDKQSPNSWMGSFSATQDSNQRAYEITTNKDDPDCDTGFGGYVDLAEINIFPWIGVEGNNVAWGPFFHQVGPIQYYGLRYNELWITDDGIVIFDVHNNYNRPWLPQSIADPVLPNNILAPLWQDMVLVEDRNTNKGISAAKAPDNSILVLEFDDVHLPGSPKQSYDFEIVMQRQVSNNRGMYEVVFAYDNIKGSLNGPLTVGLEDATGNHASPFINNENATGVLEDGLIVCFDAVTGTPPENAPEDVQASDGDHPDKVFVTWEDVEEADAYEIFRAKSVNGDHTKLGTADETYFQDTTAEPGTAYAYWVTTCNAYGCSDYSDHDIGWRADLERVIESINFFPFIKTKQ